jgi:hypothetical protein
MGLICSSRVFRLLGEAARCNENTLGRSLTQQGSRKRLDSGCADDILFPIPLCLDVDGIEARFILPDHTIDATIA